MRPIHLITAALAAAFVTQASAQSPKVVMEEMMVPSEPGIEIYVRNKRPADLSAFRPKRTILFVHGATYPAHTSFDLKLDGMSWMDYIAADATFATDPVGAKMNPLVIRTPNGVQQDGDEFFAAGR